MRKQIASWFGRKEHFFGITLGIYLGALMLVCSDEIQYWCAFTLWLCYFLSHRLEKKFYGRNGYR